MNILNKVLNLFDRLVTLGAILVGVILVILTLSVSYAVVVRSTLGWTIKGALEWWEYSLVFVTFLGSAWVLKMEGHVSMDILVSRLKPRHQALISGSVSILGLITCVILTVYGVWATLHDFQTGQCLIAELKIYRFPLIMVIPLGSFLLSGEFLRRALRYFKGLK